MECDYAVVCGNLGQCHGFATGQWEAAERVAQLSKFLVEDVNKPLGIPAKSHLSSVSLQMVSSSGTQGLWRRE